MFSKFSTTGIGSLPHHDSKYACELVLNTFDIPFWPQLPNLSFKESMVAQYSEGMPALRVDGKKERIWIDKEAAGELNHFYENYDGDSSIPISSEFSAGFSEMSKHLTKGAYSVLKGHITGPLTFTLGVKDGTGKFIFYDEELREIALMLLKAKAKWQIEELSKYSDKVIIFVDEPILSAIGTSAYLGVSTEETLQVLKDIFNAIKEFGGIAGIHCCGKADWELVLDSSPDILNFDAYGYFDTIEIYHEKIKEFISSGSYLAWGVIPTTEIISDEHTDSIYKKFTERFDRLAGVIDKKLLIDHTILTPACGTGSLSTAEAEKVFKILGELKHRLVETYTI